MPRASRIFQSPVSVVVVAHCNCLETSITSLKMLATMAQALCLCGLLVIAKIELHDVLNLRRYTLHWLDVAC